MLLPTVAGQSVTIMEDNGYIYPSTNNDREYILRSVAAGTFTVTIHGLASDPNNLIHFLLDGVRVPGYASVPTAGSGDSTPVTFTVTSPGIHGLSLFSDGPGSITLDGALGGNVTITAGAGAALPAAPAAVTSVSLSNTAIGKINVTWPAASGATGYRIERSSDGVHFAIAGAVAAPALSFLDINAAPGTAYSYRVQASNTGGFGPYSPIKAGASTPSLVPTPWIDGDVNGPLIPGYANYNPANNTWTVAGTTATPLINQNTGLYPLPTKDQLNFLHGSINGTNFVEQAQITSVSDATGWAGVMVRDSGASTAASVGVIYSPAQGVSFFYRTSDNLPSVTTGTTPVASAPYVRLVDTNGVFSGFYSTDGVNWLQVGTSQAVSIPSPALVGVAVSSHSAFTRNIATFANITTLPGAPTSVTATVAGSGEVDLAWKPVAGATSYTVYRATTPGGEVVPALASGITSAAYADTSAALGGHYFYIVTAVGPQGESLGSKEVASVVSPTGASRLVFTQQPSNGEAGAPFAQLAVSLQNQDGKTITTDTSVVTLTLNGATFANGTTSVTATAVNGVATFNGLVIDTAGLLNFTASTSTLAGVSSAQFLIAPGFAEQLAFTQQPTTTNPNSPINPAVAVSVEDVFGNVVTTDDSIVTLALGGGTFSNTAATASVMSSGGVAVFSNLVISKTGAYTLSATDGALVAAGSATFSVTPVTTGAPARLAFTQGPTQTSANANIAPPVMVAVEDSLGNIVTNNSSSVTLTLNGGAFVGGATTVTVQAVNGVATFSNLKIGTPGSYTLSAGDGALTGATSSAFTITPAVSSPAKLAIVQQPTQTVAGSAINPAVKVAVQDASGNLVTTDASTVTLTLTGGTFAGGATTAAVGAINGIATFSNLVINAPGNYTLTASDGALTLVATNSFTVTPVVSTPAKLAYIQQPTNATAGAAITPAVTVAVENSSGNVVTTDASTVTLTLSGGTFAGGTNTVAVQAINGIATFSNLVINAPGTYSLTASDSSLMAATSSSFTITPVVSTAAKLAFVQGPTQANAGAIISPAITVAVQTSTGSVVTTDTSSVTLTLNGGTFAGGATTATVQAINGIATFSNVVINVAGTYTLTASDAALTAAISSSFMILPVSSTSAKLAFVQQPTQTVAGVSVNPAVVVAVQDSSGNVVTTDGSTVTLTLSNGTFAGGANVATAQAVNGIATFANLTLNTAGNYVLVASDGALTTAASAIFTVVPAASSQLGFIQQPVHTTIGSTITPAVTVAVQDAFGNTVVSDASPVTVTLNGGVFVGGSTTASAQAFNGVATFGNLAINAEGIYTLTATDGVLTNTTSTLFSVTQATQVAAKLAFVQQPVQTAAGVKISPAVTVAVQDSSGNLVTTDSSTVTLTVNGGTFAGGSTTATAPAINGIATFGNLVVNSAGTYTLTASDAALTPATSQAFTIVAASPAKLAFIQQPGQTAAGANISPAVTIAVQDSFGNLAATDASFVTLTLNGGAFAGGATAITGHVFNGLVSFSNLVIGNAGTYTLSASDATLAGATSSLFTITPAVSAPAKLAFVQGPSQTIAGANITPAVTVAVQDSSGSVVANDSSTVTLKLQGGTFANGATLASVQAINGVATFANLVINAAGSYTLAASDAALAGATSIAFNVTPAAVSLSQSLVTASNASLASGATSTLTLQARDVFGNNLKTGGLSVAFALSGTSTGGGTLGAVKDNGNGSYTATFTASKTGTVHLLATVGGSPVTSVLPTLTVTGTSSLTAHGAIFHGMEGRTATGTAGTFTYANAVTPASSFTATINWGDGQTSAGTIVSDGNGNFHITASHAYHAESTGKGFPMAVTVKGPAGITATGTGVAQVMEAPLVALTVPAITVPVNTPLTNKAVALFRDNDMFQTLTSAYAGTINWGDGVQSVATFQSAGLQPEVGGSWKVLGTHTYITKGTYTITTTVREISTNSPITIKTTITVI